MKILLEGSEEQIKNLEKLMEESNKDLPTVKTGYYLEEMWSIHDIPKVYRFNEEESLEILKKALTCPTLSETMREMIDIFAEELKTNKNEELRRIGKYVH